MAYLAVAVPAAFFWRSREFKGYWEGKCVSPNRYLRGMLILWLTIEVGGVVALVGCFVSGSLLPNLLPAMVAFMHGTQARARVVAPGADAPQALPRVLVAHTGAEPGAASVRPLPTLPWLKPRRWSQITINALRHALAHEFSRHVGEVVVADTGDETRDALESVFVDFEELPAVADLPAAAMRSGRLRAYVPGANPARRAPGRTRGRQQHRGRDVRRRRCGGIRPLGDAGRDRLRRSGKITQQESLCVQRDLLANGMESSCPTGRLVVIFQ